MGGLLIYENETDWPIRALSFPEFLNLIKSDLIDPPVIFEDDLWDKSKGDLLAKLFVVFQTTWFMIQCIFRWITKLPMSELEIMTFSFTVLNIFTYTLWLEKPQNVSVGTRINMKTQTKHLNQYDATTTTVEEVDIVDSPQPAFIADPPQLPDEQTLEYEANIVSHDPYDPQSFHQRQTSSSQASEPVKPIFHRKRARVALSILSQSFYLLGKGVFKAELFTQFRQVVLGRTPSMRGRCLISTQTVRMGHSTRTATLSSVILGPLTFGTFFAYDPPGKEGKWRLIMFVVASGALFGGLHLIPWKFTFPTKTESLLWRVSSLYVMLNPVLLSFPLALYALLLNRSSERYNIRSTVIRWLPWVTPPVQVITIAIPLYILARLTVIVLAFTTLRSLQPDVYKDIPWSSYIPHV
jgi:hypothetical protein